MPRGRTFFFTKSLLQFTIPTDFKSVILRFTFNPNSSGHDNTQRKDDWGIYTLAREITLASREAQSQVRFPKPTLDQSNRILAEEKSIRNIC